MFGRESERRESRGCQRRVHRKSEGRKSITSKRSGCRGSDGQ